MKNLYRVFLFVFMAFSINASAQSNCPTSHAFADSLGQTFITFNQVPCLSDSIDIDTTGNGVYDITGASSNIIAFKFDVISGNPTLYTIKFRACNIVCNYGQSLPVELTDFVVSGLPDGVRLNWYFASQDNLKEMIVYRNDEVIATIANTDSEQLVFTYFDEFPSDGLNYYKVEFVDFDGYTEFSPIEAIDFDGETTVQLLGANVSSETFTFRNDKDFFYYYVTVYSTDGTPLLETVWDSKENHQLEIDFTSKGMYFISIYNRVENTSFKVVKL